MNNEKYPMLKNKTATKKGECWQCGKKIEIGQEINVLTMKNLFGKKPLFRVMHKCCMDDYLLCRIKMGSPLSAEKEEAKLKLYKVTDENDRTYGGCQWGEGIEHTADGKGELCTEHWLHAYKDALLAIVMNHAHGGYQPLHLWEAEGDVGLDDGTKVGCTRLKTLRRIDALEVTIEQRIRFGILCALEVYAEPSFILWAQDWLSGKDRTSAAAHAADPAYAPDPAVISASWATMAAISANPANAVAISVSWAAKTGKQIDFVALAHKAVETGGVGTARRKID